MAHAALDDSVRVSIVDDGLYVFVPGIAAHLTVDGHDEQLWFGHAIPDNFDGDVEMINTVGLTIANKMLQQMGWVDSN
jgi:oxalate decarboxylase/phosphoglucose isomerase-like protein (cupin superfamily)